MTESETRLLEDIPADADAFDGPFDRVAQAMVKTIKSGDANGKMLGLEGCWGGGKSTIVKIARKELEEKQSDDCETRFFIYDAWAHQGDPLRRSFLESLIDRIEECKWVSPKKQQNGCTKSPMLHPNNQM